MTPIHGKALDDVALTTDTRNNSATMNENDNKTIVGDRTGCGCMVAVGLAALALIVLMTLVVLAGSELIVACCRACR